MRLIENTARDTRLSIRLADSEADVRAAQALRYQVFFRDMGAAPGSGASGLDIDPYDRFCDHLLVEETGADGARVVGTYRLLRQSVAHHHGGFYSASEYDLAPLEAHAGRHGGELLELGRSCVAPEYRDTATIQLLWRGIGDYLAQRSIGHMFGCASFPGTDPDVHAAALAYLHHNHLAPQDHRVSAHARHFTDMARLSIGGYDPKAAWRALPPLIKGYLRVGAMVGSGAFIDRQFNTIDVFMMMPVDAIAARYAKRFGAAA